MLIALFVFPNVLETIYQTDQSVALAIVAWFFLPRVLATNTSVLMLGYPENGDLHVILVVFAFILDLYWWFK